MKWYSVWDLLQNNMQNREGGRSLDNDIGYELIIVEAEWQVHGGPLHYFIC
jgi:hypothetical protein